MSYISAIARAYHALVRAVVTIHVLCHTVDRADKYIQKSNASDALKTASTNLKASVHTYCEALEEFKNSLPT